MRQPSTGLVSLVIRRYETTLHDKLDSDLESASASPFACLPNVTLLYLDGDALPNLKTTGAELIYAHGNAEVFRPLFTYLRPVIINSRSRRGFEFRRSRL